MNKRAATATQEALRWISKELLTNSQLGVLCNQPQCLIRREVRDCLGERTISRSRFSRHQHLQPLICVEMYSKQAEEVACAARFVLVTCRWWDHRWLRSFDENKVERKFSTVNASKENVAVEISITWTRSSPLSAHKIEHELWLWACAISSSSTTRRLLCNFSLRLYVDTKRFLRFCASFILKYYFSFAQRQVAISRVSSYKLQAVFAHFSLFFLCIQHFFLLYIIGVL